MRLLRTAHRRSALKVGECPERAFMSALVPASQVRIPNEHENVHEVGHCDRESLWRIRGATHSCFGLPDSGASSWPAVQAGKPAERLARALDWPCSASGAELACKFCYKHIGRDESRALREPHWFLS